MGGFSSHAGDGRGAGQADDETIRRDHVFMEQSYTQKQNLSVHVFAALIISVCSLGHLC